MSIAEIKSMSRVEKLQTMELLWDELCHEEEEPESPVWHESVLAERQKKIQSGKARFLSMEELEPRMNTNRHECFCRAGTGNALPA